VGRDSAPAAASFLYPRQRQCQLDGDDFRTGARYANARPATVRPGGRGEVFSFGAVRSGLLRAAQRPHKQREVVEIDHAVAGQVAGLASAQTQLAEAALERAEVFQVHVDVGVEVAVAVGDARVAILVTPLGTGTRIAGVRRARFGRTRVVAVAEQPVVARCRVVEGLAVAVPVTLVVGADVAVVGARRA
jgi:hypothetical protein